jgi:pimeloyl-ACP methyl ester carboxylesterase
VLVEFGGRSFEIRQDGSGPNIVLVHGYPLDGAMWSSVARRLATRFRVSRPDLPGRAGNPATPSGSLEAYADFVAAVLDRLEPPVGLAGFSMGGYISLALMRRQPSKISALALVDTRAIADR